MSKPKPQKDPNGLLFIGADKNGNAVGVQTERHAITIAGSQSGKGVGVIVPNLLRWPHNALVIDPKGEAAKLTVEARAAMGCPSFVFDPFGRADVPDNVRVTINPMDRLDPESFTITEDIGVIADGLVMRSNPDSAYWDNGAVTIIAGLIAYVLLRLPQDEQNLLSVRRIIRDEDLFATVVDEMRKEEGLGGLCQSAASAIMAKEGSYFVSNAQANTKWLDSLAMQKALAATSFDMSQLKWGNASLFLALPSKYIKEHGRFLRLFVRTAIDVMQEERERGEIKGNQCLFLLDEFFTLGYIDEIAQSAGLMAGYGLKLWPILQDFEQLQKLYGRDGAATFFGSADLHQFFGNMDQPTLRLISEKIGNYTVEDLPAEPQYIRSAETAHWAAAFDKEANRLFGGNPKHLESFNRMFEASRQVDEANYRERLGRFQTDASRVLGKPRMTPPEIADLIRKPPSGPSEKIINFAHGGKLIITRLWPYFVDRMPPL